MGIDLLVALAFAVGALAMALWVSVEVSLNQTQNRLQSGINVGLTLAIQTTYVLSVQTVGTWRDSLLLISLMLALSWYSMLGLTKALIQSTPPQARGFLPGLTEWFQRLQLAGHRTFAFVTLLLMGVGALVGFGDPTLMLTITLPLLATLFCTLWIPRWVRKQA